MNISTLTRWSLGVAFLLTCLPVLSPAQDSSDSSQTQKQDPVRSFAEGLDFSGQWFLAYDIEDADDEPANEFKLKRGYVTVKKTFSKHLSARTTQDIAVDQEGDGEGDIEIRLKYGYVRYKTRQVGWFHDAFVEFGLVHRPWLDFEQKINRYRVQGAMFLDRSKVLRSADYGITVGALLGGEVAEEFQRHVSGAYPGRYGSVALGIYNGGGYEAIEKNENKLFEIRVSGRPLPEQIPGLQVSWLGGHGKGNTAESPNLAYNALFLSYQSYPAVLTAQWFDGEGDVNGSFVTDQNAAIDHTGWSLFGELRYPWHPVALMARVDHVKADQLVADWYQRRLIVGVSYTFHGDSQVLLNYDYAEKNGDPRTKESVIELAVEIDY